MSKYSTKQGEALLRFFEQNSDRHFTAAELEAGLASSGAKLGKATVYRHLDSLVEQGRVRRFVSDDGKIACYQFCGEGCKEHYHLKCGKCGELIHVECEQLDEMCRHIMAHHGFEVEKEKITLCGVCEKCRNS